MRYLSLLKPNYTYLVIIEFIGILAVCQFTNSFVRGLDSGVSVNRRLLFMPTTGQVNFYFFPFPLSPGPLGTFFLILHHHYLHPGPHPAAQNILHDLLEEEGGGEVSGKVHHKQHE